MTNGTGRDRENYALHSTKKRNPKRRAMASRRLGMEALEERAMLAVFTVTNTLDSGPGSLRQAINAANTMAGADEIAFDIAGAGPHTIAPMSGLPTITEELSILGFSQPGSTPNTAPLGTASNAVHQIEINGTNAIASHGFVIESGDVTIDGLVINRFPLNGVRINESGNRITNNRIGTDVTGTIGLGNELDGVLMVSSANNEITGNLLSGNLRDGVNILLLGSDNNLVAGNFIGTDRTGTAAIPNIGCGVEISGGAANTVSMNLISNNGQVGDAIDGHGVRVGSSVAQGNVIVDNRIGTDITGTVAMGNELSGVEVVNGSHNEITRNTVAFNGHDGITIVGDTAIGNQISQNSTFRNDDLGIDLGDDGVTTNDADDPDVGPNNLMNVPVIATSTVNGANVEITYSVPTTAGHAAFPLTVEFFLADADNQEGMTFLVSDSYSGGSQSLAIPIGSLSLGNFIVATATDAASVLPAAGGNTSEFSTAAELVDPNVNDGNETIATADVLGSPVVVTINDDSVSATDQDFYKYTAHFTGKLLVNALFSHVDGNIDLEIVDMTGDVVASSNSFTDNEMLAIPVVSQEMYFIHVTSADGVENRYDLEVENFAAPVPTAVTLVPESDTGASNSDGVTADTTPTFFVSADLSGFVSMGISLLDSTELASELIDGVGVELTLLNPNTLQTVSTFASPVDANGTLWRVTTPTLTAGTWVVTAVTTIVDGKTPNMVGSTAASEPTIITIITSGGASGSDPSLLESSDTGMLNNDGVTNLQQPSFSGTGTAGSTVALFATHTVTGTTQRVGTATVDSNGNWTITSLPLADGSYDFHAGYTDAAGNTILSATERVIIDTVNPNQPFLDLLSDSGRSDTDNITNVNTPTLSVTANDTPDGGENPFPHDIKYRVYVRPDGNASTSETLVVDSYTALGDFTTGGQFRHVLDALPDGVHNFKLEVEDRAGNISHAYLSDVTIDTVDPTKSFGLPDLLYDGLQSDSDSGIDGQILTFGDLVTNDTTPTFWGLAEANSIIRAYTTNGGDFLIGQTVASASDGNSAAADGRWELTSGFNLTALHGDGEVTIAITAEDSAGNVSEQMFLTILIDTLGPRVTSVTYPDGRSVFGPKPTDGPSPLTDSLIITYFDERSSSSDGIFIHPAVNNNLSLDPSTYRVVGDHNGVLLIDSVEFVDSSTSLTGREMVVQLNLAEPIPDDRLTLTIFDSLSDNAGNRLDGDLRGDEPGVASALLPSGDGIPGGDFSARFTMDARPEIGSWSAGSVYVDINGNFTFDPENRDDTNEDIIFNMGVPSDDIFAGQFGTDGFDNLAAYGDVGNPGMGMMFRWLVDLDNDGVADISVEDPANVNGLPVAGNFDGVASNGDEVGVFDGTRWWFDTDGDFRVDTSVSSSIRGLPVVGDFDGDGQDDLATYNEQEDRYEFDVAANGFGSMDAAAYYGFAGVRERPVAADMNQDGVDDIGLWVPDRSGAAPEESADWYFHISDAGESLLDRISADPTTGLSTIEFTPQPFGNDLYAQFGDEFALPVVGNFDPPVGDVASEDPVMTNPADALDVDNDSYVSPLDALLVINLLNAEEEAISDSLAKGHYPDVSADGAISPLDALRIINHLNPTSAASPQAPLAGRESVNAVSSDTAQDLGPGMSEEAPAPTADAAQAATYRPSETDRVARSTDRSTSPMEQILAALAEDVALHWN